MQLKNTLFIVIILLFFAGCKNPSGNSNQVDGEEYLENDQIEVAKDIYYRFPSPDEMLNFINKEDLNFNNEILLPVDYSNDYLDSKSQALNLGIYIADLAYITLFQRQKEALIYFQVIYGLSDKLRISSALDPQMIIRYENNIKNVDSLKALGDEALTDITNYLVKNDKERVFAVLSIGGFVETLYLAFQLSGEYSENNLILQRISDQKLVLENLILYAEEFKDDQNVKEALVIIQPIRSLYSELVSIPSETTVKKDANGKLIISGGEKYALSKEQFEKLRNITADIRKLITENKAN